MLLVPFQSLPDFKDKLSIDAKLEAQSQGFLLSFEIRGSGTELVSISGAATLPIRKNELWKETCFECFFGIANSKKYFEFNGSPSGNWALYSFEDYRQGMKDEVVVSPPELIKFEKSPGMILCVWQIPYFSEELIQNASITTVIKSAPSSGVPEYWALKHSGDQPDFHLRSSFIHRFI